MRRCAGGCRISTSGSCTLHGCRLSDERVLELLEMDIELNAQGLAIWLDRAR